MSTVIKNDISRIFSWGRWRGDCEHSHEEPPDQLI